MRRADLHIIHYPAYYPLIEAIRSISRGMVIWDYHGVTPPALWEGPGRTYLEQSERERDLVRFADYAVAHSSFTRNELVATHLIPEQQTSRMVYAVALERFRPGPRDPALLERYGLRADQPVLLYVGRIAGNKRVDTLVRALPALREALPDVQLLVIGNNQSPPYDAVAATIVQLAETLGVGDHVRFLGQVPDAELPDHYRLADLFVTASLHEGFCIPVIEAMACGRPVVAAATTALPETVGPGGLTFQPDDPADLARQVLRLLHSRHEASRETLPPRIGLVTPMFDPHSDAAPDRLLRELALQLRGRGIQTEILTIGTDTVELPGDIPVRFFPPDPVDAPFVGWIDHRVAVHDPISAAEQRRYTLQRRASRALAAYLEETAEQYGCLIFTGADAGITLQGVEIAADRALLLLHTPPVHPFTLYDEIAMQARAVITLDPELQARLQKQLPARTIRVAAPNELADLTAEHLTAEPLYDQVARRGLRHVLNFSREQLDRQLCELLDLLAAHPAQQPSRHTLEQLRAAASPQLPPRPTAPTLRARLRDTLTERLVDPELAMLAERDAQIHSRLLDLLIELQESSSRRIRALEAHIRLLEKELRTREEEPERKN
jgi:hypothetical protein